MKAMADVARLRKSKGRRRNDVQDELDAILTYAANPQLLRSRKVTAAAGLLGVSRKAIAKRAKFR